MARRIAILKPSALGDIVHALPVLTALREQYPDAHITWVVNKAYEPLLAGHPHLSETLPFDRGAFQKNPRRAVMYSLRFADELRSPEDVPGVPGKAAKTSAGEQRMAAQLVESMETDFEPDSFRSDYKQALRKLVKAKLEGKALPEPRRGAEVADLQEALRRSLEQTRQERRRRHVPTRRRARAAG